MKFMQAAASRMKKQRTDRDHAGKDHLGKIIRKSKVTGGRCIRQRLPSYLPHKQLYHFFINLPIFLIPHRKIDPGLFIYNTLIMRECPEAVDAMIGSHAAFTKAAEAHIAGCQMYEDIVDTATAETTSGSNFRAFHLR